MIQRLVIAVALCLWIVATAPAVGQSADFEAGRIIGRAIAAGVTLATDDFAAVGAYDVKDEADSSFRVRHVSARHRFKTEGRWEPFMGARIGQVRLGQGLDLGGSGRSPLQFEVWGLALEGGTRVDLGGGWFGELRGETTYSFVENRLRYADAELAGILEPLFDGVLFNWEAEAFTVEAGLGLGWEKTTDRGVELTVEAALSRLRTDPVATEHPVQDFVVETGFERLQASFEIPFQEEVFDHPLRLDARLRHTLLDEDLAIPLDSSHFTDLSVALLALWSEPSRLRIDGVGLGFTYTTAGSFDGWSVGLTFSQ